MAFPPPMRITTLQVCRTQEGLWHALEQVAAWDVRCDCGRVISQYRRMHDGSLGDVECSCGLRKQPPPFSWSCRHQTHGPECCNERRWLCIVLVEPTEAMSVMTCEPTALARVHVIGFRDGSEEHAAVLKEQCTMLGIRFQDMRGDA